MAVGDFMAAEDWVALGDRATTAELIFMVGVSFIRCWGRGDGGGGSSYGYVGMLVHVMMVDEVHPE